MKWIKGQMWCLAGAVVAVVVMTAFTAGQPTDHGFRGMLVGSSLIVGVLVGTMAGFPSVVWVAYTFAVSFLFGILKIRPFGSHDVPPSIVAGLYSLFAAPSGIVGAALGAWLRSRRRKRRKMDGDESDKGA
jgi:NAD/NADP transhydrogenase beta subunit